MVAVEWRDPPAEAVLSAREQLVNLLKANPGKWARVKCGLKSKTGTATWKNLGLEAVAAPAESDASLWDIYARGPEKSSPPRPGAPVTTPLVAPEKAKRAPLVTQKVSKARDLPAPTPAAGAADGTGGDLEAQARVKAQLASRLGHRRG